MADAKRKYVLTDKDGQKLPRTLVGSDDRGGSIVQGDEGGAVPTYLCSRQMCTNYHY